MAGLSEQLRRLAAGLRAADALSAGLDAMRAAAEELAADVRASVSAPPGPEHETPWRRSGMLEDSIGVAAGASEVVVGSSDPVAADQELGTDRVPPRPFMAPAAACAAPRIAAQVGDAASCVLREAIGGAVP